MATARKEKILSTATKLFNEYGYGTVTLYDIANEMNISRGNLAYHFKTKDDIIKVLAEEMWEKIVEIFSISDTIPSFKNLHKQTEDYIDCQREYAFIFLDNQVINHPNLKSKITEITKRGIEANKMAIAFAMANGNFEQEPFNGAYNNLAFLVWNIGSIWTSQQINTGELSIENVEALMWSIIYPHFTKKGRKAFYNFFGDDILDRLGNPFDTSIEAFMAF